MWSEKYKQEIDQFDKQFGDMSLNNDPIDKEGEEVDEAAYVAKSKSTLKSLLNVMDIQKPE